LAVAPYTHVRRRNPQSGPTFNDSALEPLVHTNSENIHIVGCGR
jgi:hypothetical protein